MGVGHSQRSTHKGLFTPRLAALALDDIAALCLLRWPMPVAFVQLR